MLQPKPPNLLFKYSNLALKMAVIIGLAAWGGQKLDEKAKNETPVYTIVLSLLGIAVALYLVIKDLIKPEDPKK